MNLQSLKKSLLKTILSPAAWAQRVQQEEQALLVAWKQKGAPLPPPHIVKQGAIRNYQQQSGYNTLVETGTFKGDMVEAQKQQFAKIISIELAPALHQKAVKRFETDAHVSIVQGDSGKVLPGIMEQLNGPAIFWLDGHYSAGETAKGDTECPIFEELEAILHNKTPDHILLIDDARLFIGHGDYPAIEALTRFIQAKKPAYQLEVADDIIRYVVKK